MSSVQNKRSFHDINDPKMEVLVTICLAIFSGDIPWKLDLEKGFLYGTMWGPPVMLVGLDSPQ